MSWMLERSSRTDGWELLHKTPQGYAGRSFETLWQAVAKYAEWEANGTCVECGDPIENDRMRHDQEEMDSRQVCWFCLYWLRHIDNYDDRYDVVARGTLYSIGNALGQGLKGHGGRTFHLIYNDGTERETDDLWDRGCIPEHFRDRLPDTAEVV